MATKKQLQAQLGQVQSANVDLDIEKRRLEEELRVAKLRGGSVFVVSDNAKGCLERVFGTTLTGKFDRSSGVHRYEAADQLASITFVPITGEVYVTDPKAMVADVNVQLSPNGELSLMSAQRISAFLEEVEFSRRPRRTTQTKDAIDFTQSAPAKDVSAPSPLVKRELDGATS